MSGKKKSYYINPLYQELYEARDDAIDYLKYRDSKIYGNTIINTYPDAKDIFSSGRIIDNVAVIPATDTEKRILSKANFTISEDGSDKVFLIKDPRTGGIRGALSISTSYDDSDEEDENEDGFDDAFDVDDTDDPYSDDDSDYDVDEEDEDDITDEEDEESRKETIIRYFDVDPEGKSFKKAIAHIMQSPIGYSIRINKYKVVRENINPGIIRMFM